MRVPAAVDACSVTSLFALAFSSIFYTAEACAPRYTDRYGTTTENPDRYFVADYGYGYGYDRYGYDRYGFKKPKPSFYLRGDECGVSSYSFGPRPQRILNIQLLARSGSVRRHEFPWHVYIVVSNGPLQTSCSGVILDDMWVLTTASCVYQAYHNPNLIQVFYGAYSQPIFPGLDAEVQHDESEDSVPFQAAVVRVHYHPRFETGRFEFDFALLQMSLELDFRFTDYAQPICLPSTAEECHKWCAGSDALKIAVGWLAVPENHERPVNSWAFKRARDSGYFQGNNRLKNPKERSNVPPGRQVLPNFDDSVDLPLLASRVAHKFPNAEIHLEANKSCDGNHRGHNATTRSQMCVKMQNQVGLDACTLYRGSSLMVVGDDDARPGVRFWLCGLKSVSPGFGDGCAPSLPVGVRPNSTLTFANLCSAISWISNRPQRDKPLPTTTKPRRTTTTPKPEYTDYYYTDDTDDNYNYN